MNEWKISQHPWETIYGVIDNNDGTVIIVSRYDTSHPDCPIKIIPNESLEKTDD